MDSRIRFETLYRAHGGAVRAFVHRRVAAAAADDVVADVFVFAWQKLERAPEDDQLAWLLGIARGVLANRRRGEARRLALRDRLQANAAAEAQSWPDWAQSESEVTRALRSLRSDDQEILMLVAWDGLDRARAAQVLGVSEGAFAVRLHRARRRLARALAAQGPAERRAGDPSAMEVS